jgi:parvulin-like peptidyl-prolyl isomerase
VNPAAVGQLGGTRVTATRQVLSRIIQNVLIERVASDHHITVTPSELATETQSFIQQNGGSLTALQKAAATAGLNPAQLTAHIRVAALVEQVGTALTASVPATQAQLQAEYNKDIDQYVSLNIAQIAVASKPLAQSILTKARAHPSTFGSLARKYSTDAESSAKGGNVGLVPRSQVISALGTTADKLNPGSIILAHSGTTYLIVHIISSKTESLAAVTPELKAALFSSQAQTLLAQAIEAESNKLGVHVSPRYGTWDVKTQSVVATKDTLSSSG